jgi:capping protein beta
LGVRSTWDIQHRVECRKDKYDASSDLFLECAPTKPESANTHIHLTRTTKCTLPCANISQHVANVGSIVEQLESKIRSELVDFYGKRAVDFCMDIRVLGGAGGLSAREQRENLAAELCEKFY